MAVAEDQNASSAAAPEAAEAPPSTTPPSTPLDDTPKHRIEHSISSSATCGSLPCKRAKITLKKGELRFGTWTAFTGDGEDEPRMYWAWKHWACVTPKQIKTWKGIGNGVPEDCPGFKGLDEESKEHVRQALEAEKVVDKTFKGGEKLRNPDADRTQDYKIESAPDRRAGCCRQECRDAKVKFVKDELRLGILVLYEFKGSEHSSWRYKHWACATDHDIQGILKKVGSDFENITGWEGLSEEGQARVIKALEAGHVDEELNIEQAAPPSPESLKNATPKTKMRKATKDASEDDEALDHVEWKTPAKKTKSAATKDESEYDGALDHVEWKTPYKKTKSAATKSKKAKAAAPTPEKRKAARKEESTDSSSPSEAEETSYHDAEDEEY